MKSKVVLALLAIVLLAAVFTLVQPPAAVAAPKAACDGSEPLHAWEYCNLEGCVQYWSNDVCPGGRGPIVYVTKTCIKWNKLFLMSATGLAYGGDNWIQCGWVERQLW